MGSLQHVARLCVFSVSIFSLGFAGCGGTTDQNLQSEVMLVNGSLVPEGQYKSIIQVAVELGGGSRALCIASIVSDTTLLTASHCLVNNSGIAARQAIALLPGNEISGGRVVLHPTYSDSRLENDVALAIFPANTFREYLPLSVSRVATIVGERITIVGFGKSNHFDPTSSGKKRIGYNKVTEVRERISFVGQLRPTDDSGLNVLNSQGDSGGPMMNEAGQVIGISSSLTTPSPNDEVSTGHYTNLSHALIRPFLQDNGL